MQELDEPADEAQWANIPILRHECVRNCIEEDFDILQNKREPLQSSSDRSTAIHILFRLVY